MSLDDIRQRLLDNVKTADRTAAAESILEVYNAIKDEEIKKVPENVFREIFLPVFTGEVKSTSEQNFLAHWTGLVGPTSPAHVVDQRGEVLFEVPPIFDTGHLTTQETGRPMNGIMMDYLESSRVLPQMGHKVLVEEAAPKLERTMQNVKPSVSGWSKIFEFYNIIPKGQKDAENENKPAPDDFFDY